MVPAIVISYVRKVSNANGKVPTAKTTFAQESFQVPGAVWPDSEKTKGGYPWGGVQRTGVYCCFRTGTVKAHFTRS